MIGQYIKSATIRHSSVVIIASGVNAALGALFYILYARALGPENFGIAFLAISIQVLLGDILDFGINSTLVKFIPRRIKEHYQQALGLIKFGFIFKMIIWFIVLALSYLLIPFISSTVFQKEELSPLLFLSFVGIGGWFLFSTSTSVLQSLQKYLSWGIVNVSTNLLRVLLLLLLITTTKVTLINGLLVYIIAPFLGFALATSFIPFRSIIFAKVTKNIGHDVFRFSGWVGLTFIIAAISAKLDTFISGRLLTAADLGIYGAASNLTLYMPQLISALGIVAAPKFASFDTKTKMITYFNKFSTFVMLIAVFSLIAIPLSYYFIPVLYGGKYLAAIPIFTILFLAMVVFLLSVPINSCINYFFAKPSVFVLTALVQLLIVSVGGYYFISRYGIYGAAYTVLISMIVNFTLPLLYFTKRLYGRN